MRNAHGARKRIVNEAWTPWVATVFDTWKIANNPARYSFYREQLTGLAHHRESYTRYYNK